MERLQTIVKKHDLSGSEASRLTGINSREVRRWTSIDGKNKKPIPWSAWSILSLLTGV
jgi:hypothetical protein